MGSRSSIHDATRSIGRPVRLPNSRIPRRRGDTVFVGSSEFAGYCSFTKAIEHMSERWILLIVRELGAFGPIGFNDWSLVYPAGSRDRSRRAPSAVGSPGLVSHGGRSRGVRALSPDRGRARLDADDPLVARLGRLVAPDHPDLAERDPDVVLGWLAQQVVREHLPGLDVVAPYGCLTDPFLDASRYVYLESATSTLLALARGRLGGWTHSRTARSPPPAIPTW